jgi:molybdopterin-guanine dinucleotide biosynthesis protein A
LNKLPHNIPIVILAGGAGSRMGGVDKCLVNLDGEVLLERLLRNLEKQTNTVMLNINGDIDRFSPHIRQHSKVGIVPDTFPGALGPLAGIASAMSALAEYGSNESDSGDRGGDSDWLLTVPGDCPFLPDNLLDVLLIEASNSVAIAPPTTPQNQSTDIVFCRSANRDHFVVGLWSRKLFTDITNFLNSGERSVGKFIFSHSYLSVNFDNEAIDPFFNINTPDQLKMANQYLCKK